MKTVGGGFTFHAWVSLGPPLSFEAPRALRRRMLYYFGAPNGASFQAFFRNSGKLVVAVVTKKGEFINLYIQDCPLAPSKWVSVLVPVSSLLGFSIDLRHLLMCVCVCVSCICVCCCST